MNKLALAALLVLVSIAGAHAFGMGKLGFQFGRAGAPSAKGNSIPPGTNFRITNTGDFRVTSTGDSRVISP